MERVLTIVCVLCLTACAPTVTPKMVQDRGASFDGNTRNSGFLGFDAAGAGYLTAHARERYNLDTGLKDEGITGALPGTVLVAGGRVIGQAPTNSYAIDAQHLALWAKILRHKKAAAPSP